MRVPDAFDASEHSAWLSELEELRFEFTQAGETEKDYRYLVRYRYPAELPGHASLEEQAKVAARILRERARGATLGQIADRLDSDGITKRARRLAVAPLFAGSIIGVRKHQWRMSNRHDVSPVAGPLTAWVAGG
jgi:hypothetical protein